MTSCHTCTTCDGIGTVRIRGRSGWERAVCPRCGGSGSGLAR